MSHEYEGMLHGSNGRASVHHWRLRVLGNQRPRLLLHCALSSPPAPFSSFFGLKLRSRYGDGDALPLLVTICLSTLWRMVRRRLGRKALAELYLDQNGAVGLDSEVAVRLWCVASNCCAMHRAAFLDRMHDTASG